MSSIQDLLGTSEQSFTIGPDTDAPRLKKGANALLVRNEADTGDADFFAKIISATGDQLIVNSDAAESGSDWSLTLARNPAATAPLTFRFPTAKGTDGNFFRIKAGTPANVIELEDAAPASSGAPLPDTTNLAFGTASPLNLFNLPALAEISKIRVVIDTPWVGGTGAQLSIGVSGTASKYVPATKVNLQKPAGTVYEFNPGQAPNVSAESLIATYVSNGATAGAARIIVHYGINT